MLAPVGSSTVPARLAPNWARTGTAKMKTKKSAPVQGASLADKRLPSPQLWIAKIIESGDCIVACWYADTLPRVGPALLFGSVECSLVCKEQSIPNNGEWNATRGNSRRTSWFGSKYTHIEAKWGRARTFMRPRRAHRLVSTWISGEYLYQIAQVEWSLCAECSILH